MNSLVARMSLGLCLFLSLIACGLMLHLNASHFSLANEANSQNIDSKQNQSSAQISLAHFLGDDEDEPEEGKVFKADHPLVLGFDRFYEKDSKDLDQGGLLLLSDLNCTSCHSVDKQTANYMSPKQAPVLNNIGARVSEKYLRRYLKNPHAEKPGSTMPSMLASLDKKKQTEVIETLVHFLVASSSDRYTAIAPEGAAVTRGEELFHSVGCVACHQPYRESTIDYDADIHGPRVPLLEYGQLEKKYNISGLASFLSNPLKYRPSGRMPNFKLSPQEADAIASYLVRDIEAPAAMNFKYYQGSWSKMPDFDKLTPKSSGKTSSLWMVNNQSANGDKQNFGYRFDGFINIPTDGEYTFHTSSDDGSLLYINNKKIVDNDGTHATQQRSGKVTLTKGLHQIRVEFFQQGGPCTLKVQWEGPNLKRQDLNSSVLVSSDKPVKGEKKFTPQQELVKQGRANFAKMGCASCHQLDDKAGKIASEYKAKPLTAIKNSGGCLQEKPVAGLPYYELTALQRTAISKAISSLQGKKFKPRDTKQRIDHTMVTSNCYACHKRDGKGGVPRWRFEMFSANTPDVGDEGKIPPLLTGVGDKLNDQWLENVIVNSAVSRPYMNARMPHFEKHKVEHLVKDFATIDRKKETVGKIKGSEKDYKKQGHLLVGKKGLTCISCHTFARHKSLGIQVMDLTVMSQRLRRDWFLRYIKNPQRYRPGTRMPNAWPENKSQKPEILQGDVDQQILAIWEYLESGKKAKMPSGIARTTSELIVAGEAVIYRNFIEGAGSRGIGVGYPEELNLAFDANNMRIALIWQGQFIDASKHWRGRGQGFQKPLGRDLIKFKEGSQFAFLENDKATWPKENGKEAGFKFRGYQLDEDRRPKFMYDFKYIAIEDYPVDQSKNAQAYFSRQFRLTAKEGAKVQNLYYRASIGTDIQQLKDGSYQIGALRMKFKLPDGAKPIIKGKDLLIPIPFKGSKSSFTVEYHW